MGKNTFISAFSIIFIVLLIFLDIPFLVRLTFIVNFITLWFITYYNVFIEKRFSPFLGVFVVFNLLFFIVAPLIQISSLLEEGFENTGKHIQNLPFSESITIRGNLYILLFNIVFFLTYFFFKNKRVSKLKLPYKIGYHNIPFILSLLLFVCLFIIIYNSSTIIFQYQNDFYKEVEETTLSNYLIVQKILFFMPLSGVFLSYFYLKNKDKKSKNYFFVTIFLVSFLIIALMLKNPLTEKRNALGPIYISLIFLFFKNFINTNYKLVRFMFTVMIIIFPLMSIITHSQHSLKEMVSKPSILAENIKALEVTTAFNSLHYDSYPDFLATIDYCDRNGFTYGKQLEPVFFFFVPRSIWQSKPEVTGFKIGNYLIEEYGFNYNNISNPYVSEGYINFGLAGVILFAFLLGLIFVWQLSWLESNDCLKSMFSFYFAISLIYFLRGDLANGFMVVIAAFIAIVAFPKVLFFIFNNYARN